MYRWMTALLAVVLVVAACGGDDTSPADDTVAASGGGASNEDGGAGDSSDGSGTAEVQVGGITYEFSPARDCFPDPDGPGGLAIRFDDGDDFVSLNQSGDIVLIRARLDGSEYADDGSPDPPVVSGNNVTWSGEMGADGEPQNVQISVSC